MRRLAIAFLLGWWLRAGLAVVDRRWLEHAAQLELERQMHVVREQVKMYRDLGR